MRRFTAFGLAALLACSTAAVVLAARTGPRVTGPVCRSALIPAYLPADGLARIAERPVEGRVVIVNPANGPGAAARPAYRGAVTAVQRSGTRVLGYVHTGWGGRPAAEVVDDAIRYRSWYGVDGVFLDETADDEARLAYYESVGREVRAAGLRLVALNPGTAPARGYFDVADIVVTFEGPYHAYAGALRSMPAWMADVQPGQVAHLVYGATRAQALAAAGEPGAGFVYATSDGLPDPWSALPPFLEEFESRLGACG